MAWDFETDPEFQKKLDWIDEFIDHEVETLTQLGVGLGGVLTVTRLLGLLGASATAANGDLTPAFG